MLFHMRFVLFVHERDRQKRLEKHSRTEMFVVEGYPFPRDRHQSHSRFKFIPELLSLKHI
jgi:hypothetical protein